MSSWISSPVMTPFTGGTKGCLDYRFCTPTAYTAQARQILYQGFKSTFRATLLRLFLQTRRSLRSAGVGGDRQRPDNDSWAAVRLDPPPGGEHVQHHDPFLPRPSAQ